MTEADSGKDNVTVCLRVWGGDGGPPSRNAAQRTAEPRLPVRMLHIQAGLNMGTHGNTWQSEYFLPKR